MSGTSSKGNPIGKAPEAQSTIYPNPKFAANSSVNTFDSTICLYLFSINPTFEYIKQVHQFNESYL